jgi:hypothetical protein
MGNRPPGCLGQDAGVSVSVPRGWPVEVWPPTEPGWRDSAVAWLLDQVPPEWRLVPALRRHPQVLAC